MRQSLPKSPDCPYEEPFNWFSYHAAMAEGRGDLQEMESNQIQAYAFEILCLNWHRFKAMSDHLCRFYSRGFMGRVK